MEFDFNLDNLEIDKIKYEKFKKKNQTIFDKQLQTLPKKIQFCKKCITSNQRPRTDFNEEGICSACVYAEKKFAYLSISLELVFQI